MLALRGVGAAAAFLGVALQSGWALFEDEVGQHEWLVQKVGQPTALAYSSEAADKVFVISENGVLASMLLKDGTLQWRRVGTSKGKMRLLRAGSRGLLSVADKGLVQAWKGSTGDLTWQREYPDRVIDIHVVGATPKQSVVVVRESEVEARTTAGKHEWSVAAGANGAHFWAAAPAQSESMVCALSAGNEGAGAQFMQIDITSGKVGKTTEVHSSIVILLRRVAVASSVSSGVRTPSIGAAAGFIVVDSHLVLLTAGTITVQSLCGDGKAESFFMKKIKSDGKEPWQLMPWQRTHGIFAATNGATTAIFGLSSNGLKHLRTFEGVAVVGPVHSVHDDEAGQPVAVAIVGNEGTQIQLLDPASGNVQPATNAAGYTAKEHGPARLLLVRELRSGEHSTIISSADHSLAGVHGSEVQWVREEGLASIRQAVFYGRKKAYSTGEVAENSGIAALGAQLSQLPMFMGELATKPAQFAAAVTEYAANFGKEPKRGKPVLLTSGKSPTSAEELRGFGANKLILCMTRASKIYALEATTSEIVWSRYFATGAELLGDASGECGEKSNCGLWMQMFPSASAPNSELIVVTPAPSAASHAAQQLLWLDPLTGESIHSEAAPNGAGVVSLMPLPQGKAKGSQRVQPFILVDKSHNVHVMPSGNAAHAKALESNAERLFHFEVDREAQVVQGYGIGKSGIGHDLMRLWSIELGSVGENIVAAASPKHLDWDHVPVHIKGDATILYKYINPNMLSVVSEDVGKGNVTALNLYVLDSVTGRILHQSRFVGAASPVQLVTCDNWVLMHYWNAKKTRFELTVVELFDGKSDDGPWNILFGAKGSGDQSTSAHHLETPVPLQQTYIFPAGVTSMGVSATLKGITPRSIIMATTTDHLFRMSKDWLNPRRPYMTSAGVPDKDMAIPAQFAPTKEEPVPPYSPVMPLRPMDVLTYDNPLGQVVGIVSSPTALESTSLIFSYGLDLFFTPVQTAKAFDVLSPGFNYPLLYASVAVVFAGVVITSFIASRQTLADRWK